MILLAYNKSFGTIELNKHIAQHIATTTGAITYEVVAGYLKHYLAVGDKVMYEKEDAKIVAIAINGLYIGSKYKEASTLLDRWGNYRTPEDSDNITNHPAEVATAADGSDYDIDSILENMSFADSGEDIKRVASHVITLQLLDSGEEVTIDSAAAVNALLLGYAITAHKAQGSEARKVFIIIHELHSKMIQREWLYTAVTRARESLYIICCADTFTKGILNQRIKGNTLEAKIEYFRDKLDSKNIQ